MTPDSLTRPLVDVLGEMRVHGALLDGLIAERRREIAALSDWEPFDKWRRDNEALWEKEGQ
jgi:hypothetical protein